MSILKPDYIFDKIEEVDINILKNRGIKGILLDLDNTLIDKTRELKEPVKEWVKKAKDNHFKLIILSNSNRMKKIISVAKELDLSYISFARKPTKSGFAKAAKVLALDFEQLCMIGDQIFTDVLGANFLNICSIYVKPINQKEYWYTKWKRPLESLMLKHFGY